MSDAVTGWTDDRVELLTKLWGEGLSASQIATALGGGVTRNAVIGKVHRLGLSGRAKPGAAGAARAAAKPRPVAPTPPQLEGGRTPPRDPEQLMRPTVVSNERWSPDHVEIPESQRVSIMELRDTTCRWPIGDPSKADFAFCGGRAVTGLPYCGHHCRIAYQPAAERRRLRA